MKKPRNIPLCISPFLLTVLLAFALLFANTAMAQEDRMLRLGTELTELSHTVPGLNDSLDFSLSKTTVSEFVRGIGTAHNLNLAADLSLKQQIGGFKFSDATVKDILLWLCEQHQLDLSIRGNIITVKKFVPVVVELRADPKVPEIKYNKATDFLSYNLRKDSLVNVAMEISRKSLHNVIVLPDAAGVVVRHAFIQNRPFADALKNMAETEGLVVEENNNVYKIKKDPGLEPDTNHRNHRSQHNRNTPGNNDQHPEYVLEIKNDKITIDADHVPLYDLVSDVSRKMGKNCYIFSDLKGSSSIYIDHVTYEEFLSNIMNGTEFTYKEDDGVYLIGERKMEGLRTTELLKMENRTIESIVDYIPSDLRSGVEIKEFIELNGLIASGSYLKIQEVKDFLRTIDQVVPMVMVEVIIVDVTRKKSMAVGIGGGLGGANIPGSTTGSYNQADGSTGGYNASFNSTSINTLLQALSGFTTVNLGQVTPQFYMHISALEADEYVKIRSTPHLATLNGHEASLKIGTTEFYAETQQNINGTLNPIQTTTQQFRSNNADLSITIKPNVSNNEMVTLDIKVEQSDFIGDRAAAGPRDQFTRSFESLIRASNGDMILLGGLESKDSGRSSNGLPWLSRVPVLRFFTGTTSKSKNKSQLNIFIKPTIIY